MSQKDQKANDMPKRISNSPPNPYYATVPRELDEHDKELHRIAKLVGNKVPDDD